MTSHIVFDSSYVSDTWDWFGSILFVMDQELWYDLTLGHSHLREFYYRMTIMSRHTLLSRWRIFEPCPFPGGYQMSFFLHIGAWDMIGAFHLVYFTQGHTPFRSMMFLGIAVPWRRLDSFHIGVWDMISWFLWCDHRSIALSSLLTYFFEMIGSGHEHLWEHAAEFSHFRVCPILGHNPFIGVWS